MSDDYFKRRLVSHRRYAASTLKIRATFVIVFCKYKSLADALSGEERKEHAAVMSQLNEVLKGIDVAGWPTVYMTKVVDKSNPDQYRDLVDAFFTLDIKTFLQFCRMSLTEIKIHLRKRELDLPRYLEELHVAYRNHDQNQDTRESQMEG